MAVSESGPCPACGGGDVARIVVGWVSAEMAADPGVELAGCCADAPVHDWVCRDCGAGWED